MLECHGAILEVGVTTALDGHIEVDEAGVARVAGTRMKVVHLVMDKMANGSSPEEMREQFPHLTLAQVYAALVYYHDHKAVLDTEIRRSLEDADEHRGRAAPQPTREQLAQRLVEQQPGAPAATDARP